MRLGNKKKNKSSGVIRVDGGERRLTGEVGKRKTKVCVWVCVSVREKKEWMCERESEKTPGRKKDKKALCACEGGGVCGGDL